MARRSGPSPESMGGARAGSERAPSTLASGRRGRDLWTPGVGLRWAERRAQLRFLRRQLSLPVSMMSQ
jgi:hypothetical protein